jgi:hypothetical protein
MIKIDEKYTDYFDDTDQHYPGGKAVDTSSGDAEDGTPYKADWMNDVNGFHQAAIVEAFGSFQASGTPDHVGDSDILDALKIIMRRLIDSKVTAQKVISLYSPEYYLSAISSCMADIENLKKPKA